MDEERSVIGQAIASAGSTRGAAQLLGCSHKTLIRRMHALGMAVAPRGGPRKPLELPRPVALMTADEAARGETVYWRQRSIEERISAVEALRGPTLARTEVDRGLVRVFASTTEASRPLHRRRRARAR